MPDVERFQEMIVAGFEELRQCGAAGSRDEDSHRDDSAASVGAPAHTSAQ